MKDANTSAEFGPHLKPGTPISPAGHPVRSWSYWFKRLLVCNPFYLASAALLLFGLYRISVDPGFLTKETLQLKFNFTSLQLYELLLVGTAMFLARRLIWYDAKLLVAMENLLVFVPFILVSQAALIEQRTVWLFCTAASVCAVARSFLAQRGVMPLRFPRNLSLIGIVLLVVNATWTVTYCALHQDKWGTKYESGAAYEVNRWGWLVLLPALIALANLLPSPRGDGKSPVQGRRFPVGLFSLWMLGSVTHLYSLGYVYDFDLHREWLAPALWVMAWTLHGRLPDYAASLPRTVQRLALALPLPVTLIAANETGSDIFFLLNLLNLAAYARRVWRERGNQLAVHLTMLSFTAAIAAVPAPLFHFLAGWFQRADLIRLAILAYVMVATFLTRNPKAAIAGALAAAAVGGAWHNHSGDAWHWAAQCGLVFFLLHSLRWRDYEHQGANAVRNLAAACWVFHSAAWLHVGGAAWYPMLMAGGLLLVCCLRAWVFQRWSPVAVPIAGIAVAMTGPLNLLVSKMQTAPMGVLALLGSLALFAIGTAAALTKHRCFKTDDAS